MSEERRKHVRITFDCEMAIEIKGGFYSCSLRNISESGAMAQINSGDISVLATGDEGTCFFDYKNRSFEGRCRVMRVAGSTVALLFWAMDVDQAFFIRNIINELSDNA